MVACSFVLPAINNVHSANPEAACWYPEAGHWGASVSVVWGDGAKGEPHRGGTAGP